MLTYNKITIYENLPKFILNWINEIDKNKSINLNSIFLHMYLKSILFYSILTLLYYYFFI
jgi:hypothetical protein